MSEKIKLNGFNVRVKEKITSYDNYDETEEDSLQKKMNARFDEGFSKGYETATDELEKSYTEKLSNRLKDVHNIALQLEEKIKDFEENCESILIQISLLIAEKIIRRETLQKTIIDDVMRESLRKIIGAGNIVVKLNPHDLSEYLSKPGEILNDSSFAKIKFETDERIEQGGCYIESETGNVDARISSQLNEMRKYLESVALTEVKQ